MTKPKRKPRGVVARFLAGESTLQVSFKPSNPQGNQYDIEWAEAILRRALKKKGGKQ